jgi:hypothetical protein
MTRPSIAIITLDTAFHELTELALQRTIDRIDAQEVIIFTDRIKPKAIGRQIFVNPFRDKDLYNKRILELVAEHISCDFALIVQYDGFALNRSLWDDKFFSFDYIGAPWPNYPFYTVGNGGFSLRSLRLIDSTAKLAHLRSENEAEDLFICRTIRPLLEKRFSVKFASEKDALRFSFESPQHPKAAFGFHGVLNLAIAYQNDPETFFRAAPLSLITTRTQEIQFGMNFIPEEKRIRFHESWMTALKK